jgi:hypothetical protein
MEEGSRRALLFGVLLVLVAVGFGLAGPSGHGGGARIYAYDLAVHNAFGRSTTAAPSGTASPDGAAASSGRLGSRPFSASIIVGAEAEGAALNSAGQAYPEVLNPGTGEPIPYPGEGLSQVPVGERVPWGAQERGAFIKQWYDNGLSTPEGGWSEYDIHHIIPREYGGTNDFENLVPVERGVHQSDFNAWWRNY